MRAWWWVIAYVVFLGVGGIETLTWLAGSNEGYEVARRVSRLMSELLITAAVTWHLFGWVREKYRQR